MRSRAIPGNPVRHCAYGDVSEFQKSTYAYVGDNPVNGIDPLGLSGYSGSPAIPPMGAYGPTHAWRLPDYYTISLIRPSQDNLQLGGGGTLTIDRYGHIYLGPALAVGEPYGSGASLTVGWLNQSSTPCPGQLHKFLTQNSLHYGGGYIVGGSESWTPGVGTATNLGFFTPGAGMQYSYAWQVH